MKTKTLLICTLIAILTISYTCEKNSPDDSYLPVQMDFIIIDSLGNDLFFDENSPYDPYDVKIDTTTLSNRSWGIKTVRDTNCFYIDGFYLAGSNIPKHKIHIQFFPGRTDTLIFDEYDNEQSSPSWEFNAFLNADTICIKCNRRKIHQITTEIPSKNQSNE